MSFSVGGAEGYLTAGSYPDDGLGEVFLKLGKQGSTLAGVMDAFSIAISIALQYGVPLETYVAKFTNMRFEPAGLTDDPDVRMAQSVMDYIFRRLALDYLRLRHPRRRSASSPPTSGPGSSRPARTRRSRTTERRPRPRVARAVGAGREGRRRRVDEDGRGRSCRRRPGCTARPSCSRRCIGTLGRRAAVHELRHQDAPRRQLLRLRGLRQHQRLQLRLGNGRLLL